MLLARLIADLEDKPRSDVIVLFSARFDCQHDQATIDYVAKKFQVRTFTSHTRATGWPAGPNALLADSYTHCVKMGDVDSVMFIESDCVPLRKHWLDMVINEYFECKQPVLGAYIVGSDGANLHINGNCVVSTSFHKLCPELLIPQGVAWDAKLAPKIVPNACPSKMIWSDYQIGTDRNPWRGVDYLFEPKHYSLPFHPLYGQTIRPAWFHGVKYPSSIYSVADRLLSEESANLFRSVNIHDEVKIEKQANIPSDVSKAAMAESRKAEDVFNRERMALAKDGSGRMCRYRKITPEVATT